LVAIIGAIAEAYYRVPEDIKEKALTYLDGALSEIYKDWTEREVAKTAQTLFVQKF